VKDELFVDYSFSFLFLSKTERFFGCLQKNRWSKTLQKRELKTNQNRLCSLRSVEQLINNSNNGQEEEYAEEEFEE
jgi:hypothetical protein